MKPLKNDQLTNSGIFPDYDKVIEPAICDLFKRFQLEEAHQPDIQVFDLTHTFPLSDPGNELIFAIKLEIDPMRDDHMLLYEHLSLISGCDEFQATVNALLDSSGDYAANCDAIIGTNSDFFILFTYCK